MGETQARKCNPRLVSVELASAGVCNTECSYCYIPKNDKMLQYHNKLVKALQDGTYIEILKKTYGKELTHIGLWGTEPTLVIHHLQPHMEKFLKEFPKLNQIGFSSNFIAHTDRILDIVRHLSAITDRKITFRFQASIDGQPEINDPDRGEGVAEKVVKNIEYMMEQLKTIKSKNVRIDFSLKPTVSMYNVEKMIHNEELFLGWFKFFERVGKIMRKGILEVKDISVTVHTQAFPTLVVPGKYTVEDGKNLATYYKMLTELNKKRMNNEVDIFETDIYSLNGYTLRFKDMLENYNLILTEPQNLTCSGLDNQAGLEVSEILMPCHRTFLFNDKEYMKTAINDSQEWDVSKFDKGIIDNVIKYFMPNINKEKDIARFMYLGRSYHDFGQFRYGQTAVMIRELALSGQASKVYIRNEKLTKMLALFLNTKMSCPVENYLNTGTLHLVPVSLIRLLGNGAFEEIFKEYVELEEGQCNM